jgi:hypothetical protein
MESAIGASRFDLAPSQLPSLHRDGFRRRRTRRIWSSWSDGSDSRSRAQVDPSATWPAQSTYVRRCRRQRRSRALADSETSSVCHR